MGTFSVVKTYYIYAICPQTHCGGFTGRLCICRFGLVNVLLCVLVSPLWVNISLICTKTKWNPAIIDTVSSSLDESRISEWLSKRDTKQIVFIWDLLDVVISTRVNISGQWCLYVTDICTTLHQKLGARRVALWTRSMERRDLVQSVQIHTRALWTTHTTHGVGSLKHEKQMHVWHVCSNSHNNTTRELRVSL